MRKNYRLIQFNTVLYSLLISPMIWMLFPVLFLFVIDANGQAVIRLEPSRAQNGGAYGEYFRKYEIGTMDKVHVATLLQGNDHFDTLSLVANNVTYTFSLEARDVRSDNYVLRAQTDSGIQELPRSPNKTYTGLTWDGNFPVCITADEQFFTAMIMTNTGAVFIESAKLIDLAASDDQFVIFNQSDVVKPVENSLCGTKIPQNYEEPKEDTSSHRSLLTCIVSEIAIADDYTMFTKYGNSVPNVETQNLAIINLVNTNYDNEFSQEVWHKVVEIFVATSLGSDPWYTGTDSGLLLESFSDWAPTGFFINNDVGSLWTNRDFDGSTIGLAWLLWPCDADDYNVLQDFSPNFAFLRVLQAHELGHNYGYGHDGSGGFIMSPSVSESTVWSAPSISTLNTNFVQYGNCLTPCPAASTGRVGIGTTSPNTTAILDITSTNKGLLMPRMTSLQRNAIYKPADGLVIYDTGTKSFWFYNNSAWVEIIDGTAFTSHANNVTFGSPGNVGIGVYPGNKLDIATEPRVNVELGLHPTNLPVYITGSSPEYKGLEVRTSFADFGVGLDCNGLYANGWYGNHDLSLSGQGPNGNLLFMTNGLERMRITGTGNIRFPSTIANRKIVLFEGVNNDHQYYGFGVNGSTLRYQVDAASADHVFFAALDGTQSKELMRIKGSGIVGIGTSSPNASAALDVTSNSKGILVPRMTTTERNAITSPANGLLVFDITTNSFWFRRLTAWVELSDNLDTEVFRNGTDKIYMGLTDSVGIGTSNPAFKLDVRTANLQYGLAQTDGNIQLATWLGTGGEIGTVTNHPFRLFANDGLNQFELLPNGKIGIGLTGPLNRFDINNGAANRTGTHGTSLAMYVTGDLGPASNGVEFRNNNGTQGIGFGYNTIYAAGSNTNQDLILAAKGAAGNINFNTNGIENVRITSTGRVGISTIAPNEKLEIAGDGRAFFGDGGGAIRKGLLIDGVETNGARIEAYDYGGGEMDLLLNPLGGDVGIGIANSNAPLQFSNTSENRKVVLYDNANNDNQFIGLGHNTTSLRYQVNATSSNHIFYAGTSSSGSTELMRIEGTGEVGIGIAAPANKLDIAGAVRSNTHNTGQALYVTGGGEFRSADATTGLGIGSNNIFATGSNESVNLSIAAKGGSGNIIYTTNGTEKMRITSSGNVGIGTTNPNAALQFSNSVAAKKVVLYELVNNANEYNGIGVGASGSMLYQVPSETANFVFSTGAGANSSLELFKFGSLSGFQINRNLTIDGGMTAWGNVIIGGNATIVGAVTIDSTIITEPFITPTMTNFTNFGAGYATAAYYKDKMGIVHLRGLVNRAANHNGIVVFTLPVGYRPSTSGKLLFTTQASSGLSRIDILTNGDVVVTAGSTGWISLDGITFRAD